MDIELFRDLDRLSQTGHFSQAAALGNLSQPAFSRRIKTLEAWVGVSLVDRTHQPVTLTEAGVQILEAGLQALARIEQERAQIREMQALPDKYVISFGAQHSIGWRFYPAWLQALEDAYGPILSRLRTDDLGNCLRDLQAGDLDFLIAYCRRGAGESVPEGSIEIGRDLLVPVCKPGPDGTPLFDFTRNAGPLPFLQFGPSAPLGDLLEPIFTTHRLGPRLRTVYENSMGGALRIRARAGEGVAWLPKSLIDPDLERGILVQTGRTDWQVDLSVRLLRSARRSNRTTRAIWAFLLAREEAPLVAAP